MLSKTFLMVVGARPNFIKAAALYRAFRAYAVHRVVLVHTGQHYDANLNDIFFDELDLPAPDYQLAIGDGTPDEQISRISDRFSTVLQHVQPDWVIVIGDVTSTLACAQTAASLGFPIAHVEAGLRSGDGEMPEERNRIQTDRLSQKLFVSEPSGVENLNSEGISGSGRVYLVGNVLIDALVHYLPLAKPQPTLKNLTPGTYGLLTLHRPANVDTEPALQNAVACIRRIAGRLPLVWPLHPRTKAALLRFGFWDELSKNSNVQLIAPQGYLSFLHLMQHAAVVITDSGGVQEETSYLRIPCLTLRTSTERPITIEKGTNYLLPDPTPDRIERLLNRILQQRPSVYEPIPLWDGHAAERIAAILIGEG